MKLKKYEYMYNAVYYNLQGKKNRKKSEGFLYEMCMLNKEKLSYKFQ